MSSSITTDLDLATQISISIGRAYRDAVEFSKVLPSYALVRFRDVLDGICHHIAKTSGLHLDQGSLFEKINTLADRGAITFGFKDRCHQIRKLCNPGAHQTPTIDEKGKVEEFQNEHAQLVQNAVEVRELTLWVMEEIYRSKIDTNETLSYSKVTIEIQEGKDVLFAATVSEEPETKYKAGLWCEAEAERRAVEFKGLIACNEFEGDQNFLKRLAATFYQASNLLKPNVDAMFRYAQFIEQGKIDGDKKNEAVEMIGKAAMSGHGEACDHYAAILYEDRKDYPNAERFWMLAAQNNVPRAYYCLWVFYTDGKACERDIAQAMAYLRMGVEQDCRDCLYALGRCYHQGEGVEKDVQKARELLQKASDLGHGIARLYLTMAVNGGTEYLADQFSQLGRALALGGGSPSAAEKAGIDPYSLCACGSGKKYKWCCMGKRTTNTPERSVLGNRIPSKRS
jgi:TPR repeat protein